MTFTTAAIRADVLLDAQDLNVLWTNTNLDRAIAQAVDEYSAANPQEKSATLTVTGRTADLSAVAPTGLGATEWAAFIGVAGVEYPVGTWPVSYLRSTLYGSTLTLHSDTALVAASVKLYYSRTHLVDGSGGTIVDEDRELITLGALGYALRQLPVAKGNAINTGGSALAENMRKESIARLATFRQRLGKYNRQVRTRDRYRPDDTQLNRDVVRFPS